jgi:hypothetical protein
MGYTVGAKLSEVYNPSSDFGDRMALGDIVETHDNRKFVFVSASTSVTSYQVVAIDSAWAAQPATSALASAGRLGVAQNNISAGSWGWVQVRGNLTVNALSTCSAAVALYTSGTAGSVDDTSTSQVKIAGLVTIANITALASTAAVATVELFTAL